MAEMSPWIYLALSLVEWSRVCLTIGNSLLPLPLKQAGSYLSTLSHPMLLMLLHQWCSRLFHLEFDASHSGKFMIML